MNWFQKLGRRGFRWACAQRVAAAVGAALAMAAPAIAQVNVTTFHNDNARDGLNSAETILAPSTVNPGLFGLLFKVPVDGDVFAQPLYLSNFTINGASHDVLYVATSNNSVYAFDADSNTGANANPLWKVNLGTPCPPSGNIYSTTGIVGTPVISLTNNAIYVVAATLDASGNWVKSIHALDLTTGAELFGGPMVIQAVVNGKGDGNDGAGHVPFNPQIQNERSALLLGRMKYVSPNGKVTYRDTVYIAFASYGDQGPYHGWVIAYDALTLQQVAVWNSTPNAKTWPSGYPIAAGGIWMSGYGPASDGRFVYFMTGNGGFDPADQSYGDSIVQMETKNGLAVGNYFTPSDEHSLDDADEDLGSGGLMLLPNSVGSVKHPDLLVERVRTGEYSWSTDMTWASSSRMRTMWCRKWTAKLAACGVVRRISTIRSTSAVSTTA